MHILYLLGIGVLAGLLSGLLGLGGGIVMVPALVFYFSTEMAFPFDYLMQFSTGT